MVSQTCRDRMISTVCVIFPALIPIFPAGKCQPLVKRVDNKTSLSLADFSPTALSGQPLRLSLFVPLYYSLHIFSIYILFYLQQSGRLVISSKTLLKCLRCERHVSCHVAYARRACSLFIIVVGSKP